MWAGRMRGHAEPLVTTLGTQRNSQKYFGVYYSELKNAQKRKRKRAEWQGDRRDGGDRERRKEGKEGGRVGRGGGEMKEAGRGWCGWCSLVQRGREEGRLLGARQCSLRRGGEEAFPCECSGSQEQLVSALNSTPTSSGHTD